MITTNSTASKIPFADDASIAKYDARYGSCNCPDRTIRGGSYILNGERVCKHMARQRSDRPLVGPARVKALQEYQNSLVQKAPVQVAAPKVDVTIAWVNFLELDPPADYFEDPFAAFN